MLKMMRLFHADDSHDVAAVHNAVFPKDFFSPSEFAHYVFGMRVFGGQVWVLNDDFVCGYASVSPIPGLQGVAEIDGCIAPKMQRKGLGTQLWQGVRDHLMGSSIKQVSHGLQSLHSSAALFLKKQGFFVEHEERILFFDDWANFQTLQIPIEFKILSFTRDKAIPLFCDLYERSFAGLPWYQPYTPKEVSETLIHATDLQFLMLGSKGIGFTWTRLDDQGIGLIEPVGIVPEYQQRGFGRYLLKQPMLHLRNRGAQRIEIGAWQDNQHALGLYRSLGFHHLRMNTYLAYNID